MTCAVCPVGSKELKALGLKLCALILVPVRLVTTSPLAAAAASVSAAAASVSADAAVVSAVLELPDDEQAVSRESAIAPAMMTDNIFFM